MEKKIIGYKLTKPQFKEAVLKIATFGGPYNFLGTDLGEKIDIKKPENIQLLKEAGVLDLWFEPVYEPEFKVGNWVTITFKYYEKRSN
jgi:hypothetical protein